MDSNTPQDDNLIEFERRLSGWCPNSGGPNPDNVLFAAGFAAGRGVRARWVLPLICSLFAIQATGLTIWALSEREGRLILESQLLEPTPSLPEAITAPDHSESTYEPLSQDYFHLLRDLEHDPILWLTPQPPGAFPPEPQMEKPGLRRTIQLDGLFDL
jgi:hypothetical protein